MIRSFASAAPFRSAPLSDSRSLARATDRYYARGGETLQPVSNEKALSNVCGSDRPERSSVHARLAAQFGPRCCAYRARDALPAVPFDWRRRRRVSRARARIPSGHRKLEARFRAPTDRFHISLIKPSRARTRFSARRRTTFITALRATRRDGTERLSGRKSLSLLRQPTSSYSITSITAATIAIARSRSQRSPIKTSRCQNKIICA